MWDYEEVAITRQAQQKQAERGRRFRQNAGRRLWGRGVQQTTVAAAAEKQRVYFYIVQNPSGAKVQHRIAGSQRQQEYREHVAAGDTG